MISCGECTDIPVVDDDLELPLIDEEELERGKRLARMERDLAAWEEFGV